MYVKNIFVSTWLLPRMYVKNIFVSTWLLPRMYIKYIFVSTWLLPRTYIKYIFVSTWLFFPRQLRAVVWMAFLLTKSSTVDCSYSLCIGRFSEAGLLE